MMFCIKIIVKINSDYVGKAKYTIIANMNKILIENFLSDNISITPEGFYLCKNVQLARIGEYIYHPEELDGEQSLSTNKHGYLTVNKTKETLFDPLCIASFEGKPIVINHTFLTPNNYKENAVGHAFNIRKSENEQFLIADLLITDKDAIKILEKGDMREISLGYYAEYKEIEKGYYEQVDIRGNHIAIVEKGRAGALCRIQDNFYKPLNNTFKSEDKNHMSKNNITSLKDLLKKTMDALGEQEEQEKQEPQAQDEGEQMQGEPLKEINIKLDKILELLNAFVTTDNEPQAQDEDAQDNEQEDEDPTLDLDPENPMQDEDGEQSQDEDTQDEDAQDDK